MEINFNVSARMALLIGRESIPSSNGAVGEIVKNAYDADSLEVTVIFDILFEEIPKTLDESFFENLISRYRNCNSYNKEIEMNIYEYYMKSSEGYHLKESESNHEVLLRFFNSFNSITIIDNGDGMDQETIIKYWMTIGTHNKLRTSKTKLGRSTVGSKGIGRFSLDKLGEICTMYTQKENEKLIEWKINWNDFEIEDAKITDVNASIEEKEETNYFNLIKDIFEPTFRKKSLNESDYKHGTIIRISSLRDIWNREKLLRINGDLLSLIPINIFHPFRIFFISEQYKDLSKEVLRPLLSDFDYRVKFKMVDNIITVSIDRSEFNYKLMNSELTDEILRKLEVNYNKYDLKESTLEYCEYKYSIEDIIDPNISLKVIKNIGDFEFSFDYYKILSSSDDSKKFYYKSFDSKNRKAFLTENSGIKIYRDGFRVRPYGEKESFSYDWLGLGIEATRNPASMTHKGGTWHIRPNQIFGRVDISRHKNPKLTDNASRQGIDLNPEFEMFVRLLQVLINSFEKDRVLIATTILKFDKELIEKNEKEKKVNAALKKAEKDETLTHEENKDIALSYRQKEEEIKALNYELNILKSYSTSSMFTRVFKHEIQHINNNLTQRLNQLDPILRKLIDMDSLVDIPDKKNPFISLQSMNDDVKVLNSYIKIMTSNTIKDKRTRTEKNLKEYFEIFKKNWNYILNYRDIILNIKSDNFKFKCFDFDIFSIVANLVINSSEAFLDERFKGKREINIEAIDDNGIFVFKYYDSGPGLDDHIKNPYDIFQESFSTKKDGTGIGMWIVQTLVNEYQGDITLNDVRNGFNLSITFPKGVKSIG